MWLPSRNLQLRQFGPQHDDACKLFWVLVPHNVLHAQHSKLVKKFP